LNHQGKKMAFTKDPIELLVYNAKDALNTIKVKQPLLAEIECRGMNNLLIQYQMAFSQLATKMELWGIPVNMAKRKARGEQLQAEMAKNLQAMRDHLNWPDFNPSSPVQVREALFGVGKKGRKSIGLTPTQYTPTEALPSTSYKAIIDHLENPFVRAFVDFIEARGAHSTQFRDIDANGKKGSFFNAIRWDEKSDWGRVFPKWNPTGQKGSRFSSSPNVQNIAKSFRDIYEAPPGWVLIGSDKDQLELRIIACTAGIRPLIKELAKPDADPHTLAAEIVYGDEFRKRSPEDRESLRTMVKAVQYAAIYLGGDKRIYHTIRENKKLDSAIRGALNQRTVSHINKSLTGRYVELTAYHNRNLAMAENEGYNEIEPLKRRRYFPIKPAPFTEIANWSTQTRGSDHVGMEMVHIQDELDRLFPNEACLIAHEHDQLVAMVKERHAEAVAKIVQHHFGCTTIEGPAGPVNLTAKVSIGKNLKEAK
jgi:DNA polymerase I-like protein with 3'-5' exonuclease and polymerase domains